jgi:hypothetical protein
MGGIDMDIPGWIRIATGLLAIVFGAGAVHAVLSGVIRSDPGCHPHGSQRLHWNGLL